MFRFVYFADEDNVESYDEYYADEKAASNALPDMLRECLPHITKIVAWTLDAQMEMVEGFDAVSREDLPKYFDYL